MNAWQVLAAQQGSADVVQEVISALQCSLLLHQRERGVPTARSMGVPTARPLRKHRVSRSLDLAPPNALLCNPMLLPPSRPRGSAVGSMAEARLLPSLRVSVLPTGGCGGTDGLLVWDEPPSEEASPRLSMKLDRNALQQHLTNSSTSFLHKDPSLPLNRMAMSLDHSAMSRALADIDLYTPPQRKKAGICASFLPKLHIFTSSLIRERPA